MEISQTNKTNEIDHDLLPNNSFTIILKSGGKVRAIGGDIGIISEETADEDLDSTLRAVHGAGITLQRTIAVELAGRDAMYKLPGDNVEQDLTPLADKIAEVQMDDAKEIPAEDVKTDGPEA